MLFVSFAYAQENYFPEHIFYYDKSDLKFSERMNHIVDNRYSEQLRGMKEPSLLELSKDKSVKCYRFTWLRTFHHPMAFRIEVQKDNTGILTITENDGTGGSKPGKMNSINTTPISANEVLQFQQSIIQNKFWELPSSEHSNGRDGAQWIVEAVEEGKYHLVDRWSPDIGKSLTGRPIKDIAYMLMFNLGKLKIDKKDIY